EPFPWHIGVFDAHCHPTDTTSSLSSIPSMKTRCLTIMATRSQDQDLVSTLASQSGLTSSNPTHWSPQDRVIPSFGWHPWFSHQMYIPPNCSLADTTSPYPPLPLTAEDKINHYQSILQPHRPSPSDEDLAIFTALPDPTSFPHFLSQTQKYLQTHPYALIGEIGLDRSFRIPMPTFAPETTSDSGLTAGGREGRKLSPFRVDLKHQKQVFMLQLRLAGEMGRAVSIHGVQAHGLVYETLMEVCKGHEKEVLSKRERKRREKEETRSANEAEAEVEEEGTRGAMISTPYPPRLCLHSYSGTASTFHQYLDPKIPIRIYVSFSTAVNLPEYPALSPAFEAMIKAVPNHMLLVESDLHTAGPEMDDRMEDIVRVICQVKGWGLEEGVRILRQNWLGFVLGTDGKGEEV
ncbi:Metallo-dependent hydrolase, partial [Amniculicola lignicola CBS 123094]